MNGMETVAPNLVVPNIRAARRMRPPPGVATRGEESDRFCPSGLLLLGQLPLTSFVIWESDRFCPSGLFVMRRRGACL